MDMESNLCYFCQFVSVNNFDLFYLVYSFWFKILICIQYKQNVGNFYTYKKMKPDYNNCYCQ